MNQRMPSPINSTVATPPFILVLDIGSSSTRALLCDATAAVVPGSMVREKSAFRVPSEGAAEDDAAALFARVERCIDALLAAVGPLADQIAAVGCATYASNVLGVDATGTPCTPIYTYADTRSAAAATELRQQFDEATVLQRTGCPLRTSYLPALFRWLAEVEPQQLRTAQRWLSVGEWLFERLFGRATVTYSVAAWTGLMDRHRLVWDQTLLAALPIEAEQLGTLADVDAASIGLRSPWAARWPALANIPWFGPVGDGAAANLGSGCIDPHLIALNIGTSGALRAIMPTNPDVPSGLWCYRLDRSHPLLGGATSEGGNVLSWARQTLRVEAAEIEQFLLDPSSTDRTLTVLPFIAGERSPGWSGDVEMTISGISTPTTALDLARAALVGVTYRWAQIAALLRTAIHGDPIIVASGGGLKHVPSWAQLIADALGMPVAVSAEPETTSRGVALLALRSIGQIKQFSDLPVALQPAYQPDPQRHAQHQVGIANQTALYRKLIGS